MQAYSDPTRAANPHALPDIEVFYWPASAPDCPRDYDDEPMPGWYWQSCFPGCIPDGDPCGPFDSADDALADARALFAD